MVVYPSYYEGQGLIPLESLASGTPVATVNQEPLTEMVDSTVGGLFERGKPSDLARCVNEMLSGSDTEQKQILVEKGFFLTILTNTALLIMRQFQ